MATLLILILIITATVGNPDQNFTTKSIKVDYSSFWLPRSFRITCCSSGYPVPENPKIIRNWTHEESNYMTDEYYDEHAASSSSSSSAESGTQEAATEKMMDSKCRIYQGSYLLSASALLTFDAFTGIGVVCKCPEASTHEYLDQSCRRLKRCLNNGHHSVGPNSYCICPEPYFGEQCEKYCDQGHRMRGADGRDYCSCLPFYRGEECRNIVCLNGGTESREQCLCPSNFFGYHCEIDANRTSIMLRFHGYREQDVFEDNDLLTRDVSSTIFSLVMIAVLVLSMYLLMKHRMQVQNRFATVRREALVRSGIEISSTRGVVIVPGDSEIPSFRATTFSNDGPPPYVINPYRGRYCQRDNLPPLPTYEDATKSSSFIRPQLEERGTEEEQHNTSANEFEINERVTETRTNNESPILRPFSCQTESQHTLERTPSVSGRGSEQSHIFTVDNNFVFNKKQVTRKSV